ncbi:hypothetical protein [Streptomyces sp. XY152]|uniref:hypothetical protein n=1 Tax=Streptomyces sp. XY152 TaxID=1415560 RepID=UPI0006AFE612|nr:hypothetical protein [Streptomyces sp. XY152]KOV27638.1 hypothetical protein ADK58_13200 [Streptomyces sp. XY152]
MALTLEVAAVRIDANAITVTDGVLGGVEQDSTTAAVEQGTQRLREVLAGRTPQPTPGGVE